MTLRIQCPACERQFKVSDDLRGRTVECGACEHQFKLDGSTEIQKKPEKIYPGEQHRKGLEAFGRTPSKSAEAVHFETAAYNQTASALDVVPLSSQEWFAAMVGGGVLIMTILIFLWGAQPEGILKDMEVARRVVLAVFMVVVGGGLVAYGCRHRKKAGFAVGVPLGAVAIALAFLMPVHRTSVPIYEDGSPIAQRPPSDEPDELDVPQPRSAEEMLRLVGYGPVKRAIKTHFDNEGSKGNLSDYVCEYVSAIWVPVMEERYKFQIMSYLQRKTMSIARPSFYRRGDGGLFVVDGPRLAVERVASIAERFGRVEEIYPEIRIIELVLDNERFVGVGPELMNKLTDKTHPAFYARNQQELEHIDVDRVRGAVRRLGEAEPLRFQVEISRRLLQLMEEDDDEDLRAEICKTLQTWAREGDDSDRVIAVVAREMQARDQSLPRSLVEFLVQRQSPEAVALIEPLWANAPISWEPIMLEIGPSVEEAVLRHLDSGDRSIQQSAIRIIKRIGTARSLPPLRAAHAEADQETKMLLESVIETIEGA